MKTINLREEYPELYLNDEFIEVSDDVADYLQIYHRREAASLRQKYRYKAFFSLDRDDGLENSSLLLSLLEAIREQELIEDLYEAMLGLPENQFQRVYAYFFLERSETRIAQQEGVSVAAVSKSLKRAITAIRKHFQNQG